MLAKRGVVSRCCARSSGVLSTRIVDYKFFPNFQKKKKRSALRHSIINFWSGLVGLNITSDCVQDKCLTGTAVEGYLLHLQWRGLGQLYRMHLGSEMLPLTTYRSLYERKTYVLLHPTD